MIEKKKLIAYVFVAIMILSAFAGLASIIPANASSHYQPAQTGASECESATYTAGSFSETAKGYVPHSVYDVGQTISFSLSLSDSNAGGQFPCANLFVNGNNVKYTTSAGTVSYSTTPSSPGTISWYVQAEDCSAGSNSGSATITVNSDPTVSISSSHNPADVGQSVTFSSSISGGTSPYSYSWTIYDGTSTSDSTLTTSSSSSFSYSFGSSGSYLVYLKVTDATGYTTSASLTETVDPPLSISISETHNPSDEGQDITYDTSVSGGSGDYTSYSYVLYDGTSSSDSQLASGSTSSFSYTFDSTGSFLLDYSVTDSNGYTVSSSLTQAVDSDPGISISSSQNPTDSGKTVEFISSVSGGTSPDNYTWTANGNTYYTKDINVTFTSPGSYTIYLTVRDAADYSVSTSMSETVNSDPVISASSNVSSADVDYPIEFCSTPSGGTGPYNESWVLNGNVISTSSSFPYSFSSPGTYTLTVTLTDSVGVSSSGSVTVTINPNPSVTISSSQNPTDSGNSVTFTSLVSGGTGTDTYNWTVDGVQESTSSSFPYSFSNPGIYYVNLTVEDSDGHTAFYSFKETVNPDPSVSIKVIHNPTDFGIWANFSAVISGGTGPYNKTWTINGETLYSDYVNYTFTSPGTFTVSLEIKDANGNTASSSIDEVVNPDPSVKINTEYNPVDQGVNDTLTAEISGGTGPYNTTWSEGSEILNYSSSFHMAFSSTGTYVINLTVVDSLGESYKTLISIKVIEKPSALIEGPNETDVSTETYWEAFGSFGTAPYDDYWYINGVNTSSGLYLEYAFPNTGKFNITLLIVDSQGAQAYAYLNVTVNPLPKVSISVSSSTTDTGLPVAISGIVSGGTGPYNYSISVSSIGIVGYSSSLDYEFPSGQYNITITVYDADGNSAHASISIIVNSLPSVSITSKYPNIDVNTTDVFNATISGGTAPYLKALWYINNSYYANGTSISYSFSSSGVYSVKIIIYDSQNVSASNIIDITVVKYPESSIIASHKNIDANVPDSFRAETSGGIGPYKDEFLIAGHIFYNSSIPYSFTTPGTYTVELIVSDYFGKDANSYINITVYPDPEIDVYWNGKPTVSENFKLYSNVTGGIGPYSVSWIFSDQDESGFNVSHIFSLSGPNTFEVKLSDSSGYTVTKNYTIYVNLYVSITANTTRGLGPLAVAFSSSVLGGSDYSFNWTFSAGHYSLEQNPLYTFPAGNYTVHFEVTSANGAKGYANISIFSLPPPVSISYSTDRNITQYFYFNSTPNWDAKAPYNMTWSFPNGQNINGMDIKYKFPVYSEFNTVIATFSFDNQTYTRTFTVRMIPAIPSITFNPPKEIASGSLIILNATVTDPDSSSFTYVYNVNGTDYLGNDAQVLFNNPGTYPVILTVTDSLGASASVERNITVLTPGHSSTITISISKATSGPYIDFSVHIQSLVPVSYAEAYIDNSLVDMNLVKGNSTNGYYNISVDQRGYSAGLYSLKIAVFNSNGGSNSASQQFSVSSQYAKSSFNLIAFFGGIDDFITIILTIAGIIITYLVARPRPTDINVDGTTLVGRPGKPIILRKGKKVKK